MNSRNYVGRRGVKPSPWVELQAARLARQAAVEAASARARFVICGYPGGYGDILCWSRFLPLFVERNGNSVSFHALPDMVTLFQRSFPGVAIVVGPRGWEHWQVCAHVHSLQEAFRIEDADIPYLRPDPLRVGHYTRRVPANVIGLCWASGRGDLAEIKSMTLEDMRPIWSRFPCVSLQVGEARAQVRATTVLDVLPAGYPNWDEAAALTVCCRAVVSVDSAIAHLAGGLGVATHIPIRRVGYIPGAPRALNGSWAPGYPRSFGYLAATGEWALAIERIAAALA